MKSACLTVALGAALLAGCGDSPENGRKQAVKITAAIHSVCGSSRESTGGARTLTPIDLDGTDGPSGFLLTCINGQVVYVESVK